MSTVAFSTPALLPFQGVLSLDGEVKVMACLFNLEHVLIYESRHEPAIRIRLAYSETPGAKLHSLSSASGPEFPKVET